MLALVLPLSTFPARSQTVQRLPGDDSLRGSFALPPADPVPPPQDPDEWPRRAEPGWRDRGLRKPAPGTEKPDRVPLPAAVPYPTSPALKRKPAASDERDTPTPAIEPLIPTVAEAMLPGPPALRRPAAEADPFAPTGVKVGAFVLKPSLEQSLGYDSNPNRLTTNPKGSAATRTEGRLNAMSDWSSHRLELDLRGSYTAFPNVRDSDQPEGAARATLRLDVDRITAVELETRAALSTSRPGAPETGGALGRSQVLTLGASAGFNRRMGRLLFDTKALVDHTSYEDGKLAGGGTLPLSLDDFASYALRSRVSYEIATALNPLVETQVDLRRHDSPLDANFYRRDSTGFSARIGNSFDVTRTLTGEIAAGYARRTYEDARFRPVEGPSFAGQLVWAASPLTRVTLRAATEIGETNVLGVAGVSIRKADVEVAHALRRFLTLTAVGSYSKSVYEGAGLEQDAWSGSFRAEYNLTRNLAIRGTFTHELLRSTAPASNYSASTVLFGLRLQR
ncbi:MAG: outer rane autotransporter barrel domain protein [Hyphomicrobiales bacterium]|nr:outer rane autotransporter barrel domain protein [Hyphomicrobiales bacterium]